MAIQKNVTAVDMKTVLNYGEQPDGRIMKKTKTYGDVRTDVTDEAFMVQTEELTETE